MKAKKFLNVALTCLLVSAWPSLVPLATAAFDSGSTGADGAFNPTTNTALQIPESGVFNFTTVNIPSGVTVTFKKNSANTPVTILAAGDVTIAGTINVSGSSGGVFSSQGAGGPGGFDGGVGGWTQGNGYRASGPGAGAGATGYYSTYGVCGGGGGFAGNGSNGTSYVSAIGGNGGIAYGNDGQLPMIGGSGGGGGSGTTNYKGGAGGGGGGAILIASSGTITINGAIYANGGAGGFGDYVISNSYSYGGTGGGGSGGSIRLIANLIAGNGTISAEGANGGRAAVGSGGKGSDGRIRLEAWNFTRTAGTSPTSTVKWVPYAIAPSVLPSLAIISIGAINVPAIPKGDSNNPDIMFPAGMKNPITVVVTANNIPIGTIVTVRMLPSQGNSVTSATATLSGTETASTASVQLNLPTAYPSLITVSATYQATASNGGPIYAEGERVDKIRVSANMGGGSTITYITVSGKEIGG